MHMGLRSLHRKACEFLEEHYGPNCEDDKKIKEVGVANFNSQLLNECSDLGFKNIFTFSNNSDT